MLLWGKLEKDWIGRRMASLISVTLYIGVICCKVFVVCCMFFQTVILAISIISGQFGFYDFILFNVVVGSIVLLSVKVIEAMEPKQCLECDKCGHWGRTTTVKKGTALQSLSWFLSILMAMIVYGHRRKNWYEICLKCGSRISENKFEK